MRKNLLATVVGTLLATLQSAALAQTSKPADLDPFSPQASMRCPFVTVPKSGGVTIDGEVRKGDWTYFTKLSDFTSAMDQSEDNGTAAPEQTQVWLTYDDTAMYVGFKIAMEAGVAPVITEKEARDKAFADDAFEIFLLPPGAPVYHFGGNAAGALWDRKIANGIPDWSWNAADVTYKAKYDAGNNWWTGEWRIPWSSFGMTSAPKDGEVWGANFCANRRAPSFRLDTWSYWKKWTDYPNNGRLIFGGKCAAFQLGRLTASAFGGEGTNPTVMAPPDKTINDPVKIDYTIDLYRKPEPAGRSFFYNLQALRDVATGEAATWAPFEQDLKQAMKDYTQVKHLQKVQPVPPEKWTGPWGDTLKVDEAGDYILSWYMRDVTDEANPKPIAGGAVPFRVRVGIQATCWPYLLTRGSVVLAGDFRAVPNVKSVKKLRGIVCPRGGGNTLAEATIDWNGERRQEIEIPKAASVPPGSEYEARLQALDESGKVVSEAITTFNRPPDPDWWTNRNKYGAEPEVPKPWTPVVWDEASRTGKVWGRDITFGSNGLPDKITNQGKDTLAAPMSLELRGGGAVQQWKDVSFKVIEARPGDVKFESVREAAGVRVKTVTQFEFDGFSLVDLSIEPVSGESSIDGLDLVLPVKTEHATFLTNYHYAPGPGPTQDMFKAKRYVGKTPEHYESPVMITTWLGTDDYGLEWSSESSKGWYRTQPKKSIEVNRKGDVTEARFHLIDATMTLKAPRAIRFGLIPTPTKLAPPEWRNLRVDKLSYYPPLVGESPTKGGTTATEKDSQEWIRQYQYSDVSAMLLPLAWSGYDAWHAPITKPEAAKTLKTAIVQLNQRKMLGLWNGGWGIAPYAPEWDPWGKEMVSRPVTPTFANQVNGSYASPYVEFMVGSWSKNIATYGLHGIRFDTVVPWTSSDNPYLGEAWINDAPGPDEGKTYGTQSFFRQRELFKKLYREFQKNGQPGMLWLGIAGPPMMVVESFVDFGEIGEGFYMHASNIKEAYPQDSVRVWMTGKAYGLLEQNNMKGKPLRFINRLGALLVADATPQLSGRDGWNAPTYDAPNEQMPSLRIWDAWSWVDRGTARFCPHWNNSDKLKASGSGEHYVSFHLQPGKRVLLVAANYEKTPQDVTIELATQKLGFTDASKLACVDAVTREKVDLKDGKMTMKVGPELFRMVKIGTEEELNGPNLDTKHEKIP